MHFLSVKLQIWGCTAGTSPYRCSFLRFLTVVGTFLITDYLFCDLLPPIVETKFLELAMSLLDFSPRIPLGTFSILLCSVFPRIITIICTYNKINEIYAVVSQWKNCRTRQFFSKILKWMLYISVKPVHLLLFLWMTIILSRLYHFCRLFMQIT